MSNYYVVHLKLIFLKRINIYLRFSHLSVTIVNMYFSPVFSISGTKSFIPIKRTSGKCQKPLGGFGEGAADYPA